MKISKKPNAIYARCKLRNTVANKCLLFKCILLANIFVNTVMKVDCCRYEHYTCDDLRHWHVWNAQWIIKWKYIFTYESKCNWPNTIILRHAIDAIKL